MCSPSPAIMTSPYEWRILESDDTLQTNNTKKALAIYILFACVNVHIKFNEIPRINKMKLPKHKLFFFWLLIIECIKINFEFLKLIWKEEKHFVKFPTYNASYIVYRLRFWIYLLSTCISLNNIHRFHFSTRWIIARS